MLKNIFILLCSLCIVACGGNSKEQKTISWATQVVQKLDSVYQKEESFIDQWLVKTEKMRDLFVNNQEKKENYPSKMAGLSEKIQFYKNTHFVFYTDSLWKKANMPFLPPVSTTEKNMYLKKYQKNWDTTLFSSILRDKDDIEKNITDFQNLINGYKSTQYIVVYKMLSFKAPKITDLGFEKGKLSVQAFLYNLETQNILIQFSLQTENKDVESFQTQKPAQQEEYLTSLLYQQIEQEIQNYLSISCK
jgi:hypothetical protein